MKIWRNDISEGIFENEMSKILRDLRFQTDQQLNHNRPEFTLHDKR